MTARYVAVAALATIATITATLAEPTSGPASNRGVAPVALPGLSSPVRVLRDTDGIPHILGLNELDVVRVQGWVHAEDRLFQMDSTRRLANGTLAELLGPDLLASDVELQTIGLGRAAQRSLEALSPELRAGLLAYAEGVNAWIAANPLPAEYAALEISTIPPWTEVDCVLIGKAIAFSLSFDLDIDFTEALGSYQAAGAALGFDGDALFAEDLFRAAPFDPASTVPDASAAPARKRNLAAGRAALPRVSPSLLQQVRAYRERIERVPFLRPALRPLERLKGSNEWAVSGSNTVSGRPLLANDPHLSLDAPATFYQNHLRARADGLNVAGSSFPGTPFVVLGQNMRITWGATTNPMDVTDMYADQVINDPNAPSGLRIAHDAPDDALDQLELLLLSFSYNVIGDGVDDNLVVAPPDSTIPPFGFIVPRRNMGPIVSLDLTTFEALSIQYSGFSATRELETFRAWNYARNLEEFQAALADFDFGSQNFAFADIEGNIAYFTSAEMPLREDLQAGEVAGLPPYFVREGSGGNEWLRADPPPAGQTLPFEILPPGEMPQLVNPPAGYFVNANNDPAGNTLDNDPLNELRPGGGIYYLNPGYAPGLRAGRVTQALREALEDGPIDAHAMQAIQADVVMLDAQVLTPYIVTAFANAADAGAPAALAVFAADPRVAEASGRLAAWDHSAPTGIAEGYDASDTDGVLAPPAQAEIDASIAATIYSLWRGQFIRQTIDATLERVAAQSGIPMPGPGSSESVKALRNLLDRFDVSQGVGASGLDFFAIEDSTDTPAARRDTLILASLAAALDLLAGPDFASVFAESTNQADYRWGKLHRIVFDHPLGGDFSIPPAGGLFPDSLPGLSGISVDGGFGVVDASSHSARAQGPEEFRFGSGPVRRYVGRPGRQALTVRGETSMPGGASGILGDPLSINLLGRWLTNDTYPLRMRSSQIADALGEVTHFLPAPQ